MTTPTTRTVTTKTSTEALTCPGCGTVGPKAEVDEYARKVSEAVFGGLAQPRILKCPDCDHQWREKRMTYTVRRGRR